MCSTRATYGFLKQNAVKRNILGLLCGLFALVLYSSCAKQPEDPAFAGLNIVNYPESDAIIPNPERGFYSPYEVRKLGEGIPKENLAANRRMGRTIFLLEFHITEFVQSDISEEYLEAIKKYFLSLRTGGAKCILRFCYSNGFSEKQKPWDATEEQVLRHVAQLKPILQEFYDVIMVMQAGFIGSWGEWYYTENFTDYESRKHLTDALLDALPESRQISLRTPDYKIKMYGLALGDTVTRATAHSALPKARLGGHNDCYLADAGDQGTYKFANDRAFWAAESPYMFMGGESCQTSIFCHCEANPNSPKAIGALADLAMNHYTYLNIGYHTGVLGIWRTEGCFDQIQNRLGYRYVLTGGGFTPSPEAGSDFRVVLKIRNDGFAPAQNPRDADLILTDKSGNVVKTWKLDSDPRFWMAGETTKIDQTIQLPDGISGEFTLSLNLPDPCETLHDNPLFSIQLANEGIWDENTGYNKLTSFTIQ